MDPTIYKPGAYKTPGIYKGAGGIYKGRGVYNDGSGFNYGNVIVDGEEYKTLNYNGRTWTVENLRNNIPTNYDIDPYGRLYKYSDSVAIIESKLYDGWRLPTQSDFNELINFLGTSDPLDWISKDYGGTNANGFNLQLVGYITATDIRSYENEYCFIWSKTQKDSGNNYNMAVSKNSIASDDYASIYAKLSIRLVNDA